MYHVNNPLLFDLPARNYVNSIQICPSLHVLSGQLSVVGSLTKLTSLSESKFNILGLKA